MHKKQINKQENVKRKKEGKKARKKKGKKEGQAWKGDKKRRRKTIFENSVA